MRRHLHDGTEHVQSIPQEVNFLGAGAGHLDRIEVDFFFAFPAGHEVLKRLLERFNEVVETVIGWIAIVLVVLMAMGILASESENPKEGQACGEGNHWKRVGVGPNSDLSCEED